MNDLIEGAHIVPAVQPQALPIPVIDVAQVNARVQVIQQVMEVVMKPETHYGVIKGTDKPTLLKPGSEALLSAFQLSVEPIIDDLSTDLEVHYRIKAVARYVPTGAIVGYGIGECSTLENKYMWEKCWSKEEYEALDPSRRQTKTFYDKNKRQNVTTLQKRANPFDKRNTILKMAKKRAQVDLCLTALACSDMFEQDLEEFDEESGEIIQTRGKPATRKPQSTGKGGAATEGQIRILQKALDNKQLSAEALCKHMKVESLKVLTFDQVNDASEWIAQQPEVQG